MRFKQIAPCPVLPQRLEPGGLSPVSSRLLRHRRGIVDAGKAVVIQHILLRIARSVLPLAGSLGQVHLQKVLIGHAHDLLKAPCALCGIGISAGQLGGMPQRRQRRKAGALSAVIAPQRHKCLTDSGLYALRQSRLKRAHGKTVIRHLSVPCPGPARKPQRPAEFPV